MLPAGPIVALKFCVAVELNVPLLLKTALLLRLNVCVPLQLIVPWFASVRVVSATAVAPVMLRLALLEMIVDPAPLITPPVQVFVGPLSVTFPAPVSIPPLNVKFPLIWDALAIPNVPAERFREALLVRLLIELVAPVFWVTV